MRPILPTLLVDGYKTGHPAQYEQDTILVSSNLTPRGSRVPGVTGVVPFGPQYWVREYLIDQFNENFFWQQRDPMLRLYKRYMDNYLGPNAVPVKYIGALHELGYMPLHVKALPEGSICPMRVPMLTIRNTVPEAKEFGWVTNSVETNMSNVLWLPTTSATTALEFRKEFQRWAVKTGAPMDFVKWQGHDFSYRGLPGTEAAMLSGGGHLLSFTGTDTVPALWFLEEYYGADVEKELVGGSVPATEHSVMCMGRQECERDTIKRLITEVYPNGIVSIVCDTWDFWGVITNILPSLKAEIMARNGKVVVRPDSGDPVKIVVGDADADRDCVRKGAWECLYDAFGGAMNGEGYRDLDSHVGLIYGDAIDRARQTAILSGLAAKGFSTTPVLGIGSFSYQYVTRDTYGLAVKATYGETRSRGPQPIFKKPATDDGVKNSAKGLLMVDVGPDGRYRLNEDVDWATEATGALQTIFKDGERENFQTLAQIRARIDAHVAAELAVMA